ncbi:MAG: ATP-binding cassette domain-containing protein [Gammaproteobacteria bacterium]|nr:ATP-binding cassette domain-containing protein [Gammaproteobacteria bacterium]
MAHTALIAPGDLDSACVSPEGMTIRHSVPGRIRWELLVLSANQRLCADVQARLRLHPDVGNAHANPDTGRLLVKFNSNLSEENATKLVAGVIAATPPAPTSPAAEVVDLTPDPQREDSESTSSERTSDVATGVAVLGGAAVVIGSIATGQVLWLAGITAAGVAVTWAAGSIRRRLSGDGDTATTIDADGNAVNLGPLGRALAPYRNQLLVASGFAIASVGFALGRYFFLGLAINVVVGTTLALAAGTPVALAGVMGTVLGLGILSVLSTTIQGACTYYGQVITFDAAHKAQHRLRIEAYQHMQCVEMAYFDTSDRGGLVTSLSDDINQLEHVIFAGWEGLRIATNGLALCILFGVILGPAYPLLVVAGAPLVILVSVAMQRWVGPFASAAREETHRLNSRLSSNFEGIATVRSFTAEGEQLKRVSETSTAYLDRSRKVAALASTYRPAFEVIVIGATVITILVGAAAAVSNVLSPGMFFLLVMGTRLLLWPLTQFGRVLEMAQRGWTSITNTCLMLEAPREPIDTGEPLPIESVSGGVVFENVHFSHVPDVPVLTGINLKVEAGKTTAIIGATGCGKTTLVKLLLRFYDLDQGAIRLDTTEIAATEIADCRVRDLRAAIAVISQDVFLFTGTIAENISLGSPHADLTEIQEAARVAEAHEFIEALPESYDTIIGEQGRTLSGGQRQRLSIARAVLKDAPLLILDEATSHVDNRTQAQIQQALARLRMGRTMIVIAHRLTTVSGADTIYVLKDGQVLEHGNHRQLLDCDGLYARLWKLQVPDVDWA